MRCTKQGLLLILLICITIINGIIYIYIIPPWQSPDEPTHFEYAQCIIASEGLFSQVKPNFLLQEQIISSMDNNKFWMFLGWPRPQPLPTTFAATPFLRLVKAHTQIGRKPPLYYFLASLLLRLTPHHPIIFKFYVLRAFSLLLSIVTVSIVFFTAKLIFPEDDYFPLISAAFVAFLPEFILIGTSVSPDPLANLVSALFIFLMIKIQVRGFRFHILILTYCIIILSAFVTYKCLELIPIFMLGICVYYIFQTNKRIKWRRFIFASSALLLIFLFVFGFLVWIKPSLAALLITKIARFQTRTLHFLRGDLHLATYYYPWFHNEVFKSFWIKFGWAMYPVKPIYYFILKVVSIMAFTGLAIYIIKILTIRRYVSYAVKRSVLVLIISAVLVLIAYYCYWGIGSKMVTAQGRHLFIGLSAWAILFVLGLRELFPKKWRVPLYLSLLICFVLFNLISIFSYILPVFRS